MATATLGCDDAFTAATGAGTGGAPDSSSSASESGGASGEGGSATAGGGGGASGGAGGAPTCPGTLPGCVVDWAGHAGTTGAMDGVGQAALFQNIQALTSSGSYVYVTDNHAIRRIDVDTATVTTWAGMLGVAGFVNGTGSIARFNMPLGLAADATRVWVSDGNNCVVRQIAIATAQVSTIAGTQGVCGSVDGLANVATFEMMRDLAWDGSYLYLVQANHVLRRIDPSNGEVVTIAGTAGMPGLVDASGAAARFSAPRYLEAIAMDNLYVGDTENHRPRHVDVLAGPTGDVSSPYGSSAGYNDGIGALAQFRRPRGVSYDGADRVFVSDTDNFCIRAIDLANDQVTTIAGMAMQQIHVVGVGTAAGFGSQPLDLHYHPASQDLFISEGDVLRRMYAP